LCSGGIVFLNICFQRFFRTKSFSSKDRRARILLRISMKNRHLFLLRTTRLPVHARLSELETVSPPSLATFAPVSQCRASIRREPPNRITPGSAALRVE
jgi:hypothetical protein